MSDAILAGAPVPESESSVHVAHLSHSFPREGDEPIPVLEQIDLTLRRGEIVIMVGRAGAGKTTLLTLIGALRRAQQGSLRVLGSELRDLSPTELVAFRRRLGFVFQRHNLFESLTARQNVAMGLRPSSAASIREALADLRAWDEKIFRLFEERLEDLQAGRGPLAERLRGPKLEAKRAALTAFVAERDGVSKSLRSPDLAEDLPRSLLTFLGLRERTHHKPRALSGGQRQRVAIARALANRPELILADEPTASLDEENGRVVATLIQEHAQSRGCTIILVTHDPQILDIAHRIVTMEAGRIIANVDVQQAVAICDFLKHCDAFASLTPEELREVADKMTPERHPAGSVIIRQGDEGEKFYLIKQGQADVFIGGESASHRVRTLRPGEFFGERALIDRKPRSATVKALTDVEVYALGQADFHAAVDSSPSFEEQVRRVYQSLRPE
jgi:putative ABC transport system ATP-binding protein